MAGKPLVFDTGPLRHFAAIGWLGELKHITNDRLVIIPEVVRQELADAIEEVPAARQVLEAQWIRVSSMTELDELTKYNYYAERLVVGRKNRGECGVLALGAAHGWEVVIDDRDPREIGSADKITVTTTLALLCQAIKTRKVSYSSVEALVDDLVKNSYFLPFAAGGFWTWALVEGFLDHDDR